MDCQSLSFLQEMYLKTQNICSWNLTMNLQLLYTNCPEEEYFYSLFSVSTCPAAITAHFSESPLPIIATDRIGFVWIAALLPPQEKEAVPVIHMLGPVFTSRMTETYLDRHLSALRLSQDTGERLMRFIRNVPTLSVETALAHAGALHYCLTGTAAPVQEIRLWSEPVQEAEDLAWGDTRYHGSWLAEQRLFKNISEGRYEDHSKTSHGKTGSMSSDPLRQAKNEMIVFAVICSRAAIIGGVSSEGALNLSDYFVQRIEAAETVSEIYGIGAQMHQVYINRVRRAKESAQYSALVRNCMDYVETHIFERITLGAAAREFGYSESYVSRKFREETGESLVDYVNRQKMHTAKNILEESNIPIAELSERLSFSSPSYFSLLFRRQFGVNPADFQKKGRES